jgi:hypothetical protein
MHAYKRSIIVQLGVFGFFFFYGLDGVLVTLVERSLPFIITEFSIALVILGLFLYFYYKTPKEIVFVVQKASMDKIKIVLYTIAISLIVSIVFSGISAIKDFEMYAEIITGTITSLAGLFGVYIGFEIINQNK